MSPSRLSAIVRDRFGVAAIAFVVVGTALVGVVLAAPARYTASARVLVDTGAADPLPGASPPRPSADRLAAQVDVATSQKVALRVVDALRLADAPAAASATAVRDDRPGLLRHHLADGLFRDLEVSASVESGLLRIAYTARDPAQAAAVANAFAQAYASTADEVRRAGASRRDADDGRLRPAAVVLDVAAEPGVPDGPGRPLAIAGALAFATLAALGAVLVAERRDRRIRGAADLAAAAGAAPIGELAALRPAPDESRARVAGAAARGTGRDADGSPGRVRPGAAAATVTRWWAGAYHRTIGSVPPTGDGAAADAFATTVTAVPAAGRSGASVAAGFQGVIEPRAPRGAGDRSPPMGHPGAADPVSVAAARHGAPSPPYDEDAPTAIGPRGEAPSDATSASATAMRVPAAATVHVGGAAPSSSAAVPRAGRGRPLGRIMVEAGMLQEPAVERILAWARQEGLRFGEAAVRSRLATDEQVRRALAFQFDHAILDPTSSGASPELVAAFDAPAQVVADLRRLRTHVDAWSGRGLSGAGGPRRGRVLAVAGAGRGEGRTFVAANLAVSFSQIGRRTLLVDGDLSGGRIHELFGVDNRTGLSAMLAGRTAPGAIRRVPGLPDLSIVTSGAAAPNATDLLSRPALETLLDAFRSRHELIVVDAPPAAAGADAELLARQADGVLLVARAGRSGFDAVRRFAGDLRAAGVSTLGPVLVRG